jgi:hydrogenase-4 component F
MLSSLAVLCAPRWTLDGVAAAGALVSAASAVGLSAVALAAPASALVERWLVVDAAAGLLVGVIGVVGVTAVLVSPAYLSIPSTTGLVPPGRRPRIFYVLLFNFWALLAAVPLVGNLAGAWLLLEATTAVSALLVGFGGKPRALEAAWKYLILTSLGLGVALLGIAILAAEAHTVASTRFPGGNSLMFRPGTAPPSSPPVALAGLPPDRLGAGAQLAARRPLEAPAPVSALLSAALLPAVLLSLAVGQALSPVIGASTAAPSSSVSASSHSPSPCLSSGTDALDGYSLPRASSTWG